MRAKSDAERRNDAAQTELAAAEKAVREAEKTISSASGKILTKQRSLRDLENTINGSDYDRNSGSNRYAKKSDLEGDISRLETEKSNAESALTEARARANLARAEGSSSSSAFSVEADRKRLDYDAQRTEASIQRAEIAVRGQELQEQKLAQIEKAAAQAAETKLEEARLSGESAERISKLEKEFKAASQRFDWEQRFALSEREIDAKLAELDRSTSGQLDLASLQAQVAEERAKLNHVRTLEVIKANTLSDVARIRTTAEEHRQNVTHEVNEDIRKAFEMLSINAEQAGFETMNAIRLLIVKHQLDKNFETHKTKLAREGRGDDLAELAADYQTAARWIEQQEKPD